MAMFAHLLARHDRVVRTLCMITALTWVLAATGCGGDADKGVSPAADFEDLGLAADSYDNGKNLAGVGFVSGGLRFSNSYDATYDSWQGFAASSMTDTATAGWTNQYSAITGGGQGGGGVYLMAYAGDFGAAPSITAADGAPFSLSGVYVTCSVYAYLSMRDGDDFAKKFGGDDGNDPDWFMLTFTGYDAAGASVGTVDFYLADFRFAAAADDYLVDDWRWVDLSALGEVSRVDLSLSGGDVGDYGLNTPAYVALDTFYF